MKTIHQTVRENENEWVDGTTHVSKHVDRNLYDDINKIEAYLNSKHISGEKDSLGRKKPFYNIVVAAANIWYRATDIDRSDIRIYADQIKDIVGAFFLNVANRQWMRDVKFGKFLNSWGLTLARYGSAILEFVEKDGELVINVLPWNRTIIDPIDFESNPLIKVLELTEAQLRQNESYDQEVVEDLIGSGGQRENLDGTVKDQKSGYYRVYEVHGNLPLAFLTGEEKDEDTYQEQMHVVSYISKGNESDDDKDTDYDDFTLYSGRKERNNFIMTHLIEEEGQSMSYGAVQQLFDSQWMENHSAKAIKDQLDFSSKMILQTADKNFAGKNVLQQIVNGQILYHDDNKPLTKVNNQAHEVTSWQSVANQWKNNSREIVGISEAMTGQAPKSGTAWRQTQAVLTENHSLFEEMKETKALYLEDAYREYIIPFLKKKFDSKEEIAQILDENDIERIDMRYIKNRAVNESNELIIKRALRGYITTDEEQAQLEDIRADEIEEMLKRQDNNRFFKPSRVSEKTWKEQFKGLEATAVVDIVGEQENVQEALATLNTVFTTVASNPEALDNPEISSLFNRILNKAGSISPLEVPKKDRSSAPRPQQPEQPGAASMDPVGPGNAGNGKSQNRPVLQ